MASSGRGTRPAPTGCAPWPRVTLPSPFSRTPNVADRIVTGDTRGALRIWDADELIPLLDLQGPDGLVYDLVIGPAEDRILSTTRVRQNDIYKSWHSVRVWRADSSFEPER